MNTPNVLPVISASRRTDLPRCFPSLLAAWLQAGRVEVRNPFNGRAREVEIAPAAVHTLVLWSKDYSRLLADEAGLKTRVAAYPQVFFHLTVTGLGGSAWEPGVRPAEEVARQFGPLARLAGDPRRITWRFDPLVFWQDGSALRSNAPAFAGLAAAAAEAGITRVAVSLCQEYAKARRRTLKRNLARRDPAAAQLEDALGRLQAEASRHGLELRACCSPELERRGVPAGRCVDGELLAKLHPQALPAETGKDPGQRKACGCTPSVDIGSYQLSCPQGCAYCYANPE